MLQEHSENTVFFGPGLWTVTNFCHFCSVPEQSQLNHTVFSVQQKSAAGTDLWCNPPYSSTPLFIDSALFNGRQKRGCCYVLHRDDENEAPFVVIKTRGSRGRLELLLHLAQPELQQSFYIPPAGRPPPSIPIVSLIKTAWCAIWEQTNWETERERLRATSFFCFLSAVHSGPMNYAQDWLLKYSDISGQLIKGINSQQERNLIKNVFIICGGKQKKKKQNTTEACFEMQICTKAPAIQPNENFSGCNSTNSFCYLC